MIPGYTADFCLLIPCYNNEEGLIVSLKTVTYEPNPFLVLVVDDGSAEPLQEQRVKTVLGNDFPLKIIRNDLNQGITKSLNTGLKWISQNVDTLFVARLDCGDTCKSERFYLQVQYLQLNQETGLLGSWCWFTDEDTGGGYLYKSGSDHQTIERQMYFRNVFMHATVMFRLSLARQVGFYPEGFELVEDYVFFWKMMNAGKVAILEKVLVTCKVNKGGISFQNKGKQLIARKEVVKLFGKNLFLRGCAILRLVILIILPKNLLLFLKKWRG